MAKVYRAPEPFKAPGFTSEEVAAYTDGIKAAARKAHPGDALAGEQVNFQIADGYAQYVVWSSKPLSLVHLEVYDRYSIPAAHARGLRVADIKAMVKADKALEALFAAKAPA